MIPAALGIFITGFSSILTGLNFIVTIHRMRAPGMTWFRLPLFVWAHYATSLIMMLATPVLAITVLLVAAERALHLGIFDPALGGDPVLFQHLFWFYSHPAVYIMILPAMGVISEIVAASRGRTSSATRSSRSRQLAIAVVGFLVWGHHMFVAGPVDLRRAGLLDPHRSGRHPVGDQGLQLDRDASTRARSSLETPMLYAFGFIGLFTIGGLTGLFLAAMGLDVHVHDTYFVVAHFHYIMVGGAIMGYLGGLHYWWPKITGRMYSEAGPSSPRCMVFVGFNLTFFPQFIAGYLGHAAPLSRVPAGVPGLNVLSTAGASILGVGYLLPMSTSAGRCCTGEKAGQQPVGRPGLEWEIPSPPPTENFTVTPVVTAGHAPVRARARRSALPDAPSIIQVRFTSRRWCRRGRHPAGRPRRRRTIRSCSTTSMTWSSRPRRPTLGMWVFLVTEIMFFGGLFLAYIVYRAASPEALPGSQPPPDIGWAPSTPRS